MLGEIAQCLRVVIARSRVMVIAQHGNLKIPPQSVVLFEGESIDTSRVYGTLQS
jgi:hypothetical protein